MASVMIVDDEDVLVEMIAALIEDLGYRPVVATNGRDALAMLQREAEPPLVLFSDVMMPQMNGIALAQELKRSSRLRGVPIVLMSAAGRPQLDGIADHFIQKPFDLAQIEALIAQYAPRSQP